MILFLKSKNCMTVCNAQTSIIFRSLYFFQEIIFITQKKSFFFQTGFFKFPSNALKSRLCKAQNQKIGAKANPKRGKANCGQTQRRKSYQKSRYNRRRNPKRIVFQKIFEFNPKNHIFSPVSWKKYIRFDFLNRPLNGLGGAQ
jgi:hypothetical protein